MSQCRWCDRRGLFRTDAEGVCKKCREEIDLDTGRLIASINRLKRSFEETPEPSVKLEYVRSIIEQAKRLARYERRGISLNGASSGAILEAFRAHHDRLLAWDRSEHLGDSIDIAIEQLDPYQELYGIQDALKLIKLTRTLCRDLTSCRRIAVINHKGGVGKTTTAINLSGGLAEQGKKVLAVDFDPQANLTDGLGIDEHDLTYTAYEFMKGAIDSGQVIRKAAENLYVLPSSLFLSRTEKEYAKTHDNMYLLRNALEKVSGYDYIIIDCPPSLGVLTLNALAASTEVLIPLLPEYYSLKGMRKLYEVIDFVQRKINKSLHVSGVIGIRYDHRKTLHREVFSKIRENLGDKLFYAVIREAIVLAEAASFGQTIFSYKPSSHGARDYRKLTDMVLSHNHHGHL